jgi:hypothetical protein
MVKGIKHRTHKSHDANEKDIRKHDNEQFINELPFFLYMEYLGNGDERAFAY